MRAFVGSALPHRADQPFGRQQFIGARYQAGVALEAVHFVP